MTLTTPIRG